MTWHVRLGRFGMGYGVLVVIVGLVTGISRSADRVLAGRSANGLLLDVVFAMALFSIFFGAARVRAAVHRQHVPLDRDRQLGDRASHIAAAAAMHSSRSSPG